MTCNATLITVTVEPCPGWAGKPVDCCGGPDAYDRWAPEHVTLHTLTCEGEHHPDNGHRINGMDAASGVFWWDDTPGATPHTPPADDYSDAALEAAERELVYAHLRGETPEQIVESMRKAAARAVDTPPSDVCRVCGTRPQGHPVDRLTGHPLGCTVQHGCICEPPADVCDDCDDGTCRDCEVSVSCHSCRGTGKREFHYPGTKPPTWGRTDCSTCGGTGDRLHKDDLTDEEVAAVEHSLALESDRPTVTEWPQWCETWGQEVDGPHWDPTRSHDCPGPHEPRPPKHWPAVTDKKEDMR